MQVDGRDNLVQTTHNIEFQVDAAPGVVLR
jgi:hypothetical protein